MENWSSSIVTKWMQKIGLGQFSTVLNADKPFTGIELVEANVSVLVKVYKMDKRPAKKLISERDKAMNCLNVPKKSISRAFVGEIGAPYDISRPLHVEYVSGKGFMGLPQEWENTLATSASDVFIKDRASAKIRRKASMFGYKRNPLNWSMDQVIEWLHKSKLDMFVEEAVAAEVDGQALLRLTEDEFLIIFNMKRDSDTERLFRMIAILKTSSGLDISPDSSFSSSVVPSIAADISSSWAEVEMSPRGAHPPSPSRQSSFRNSIKGIFARSESITDMLTRKDSSKDLRDKKRESMIVTKKEFKGISDRTINTEPITRKESLKDACINVC